MEPDTSITSSSVWGKLLDGFLYDWLLSDQGRGRRRWRDRRIDCTTAGSSWCRCDLAYRDHAGQRCIRAFLVLVERSRQWREPYHRLRIAGIDRYRTLSALQPGLRWLRFAGGLAWYPEGMVEELRRRHDHEVAHGYDSHLLRSEDVRVALLVSIRLPSLMPVPSGIRARDGSTCRASSSFLIKDFLERGGKLVTEAGKCTVRSQADSVTGVATGGGELVEADAVVLATGAAVPGLVADLGITIPDATTSRIWSPADPCTIRLRAVLSTPRISVRPTPEGALAIDSDWTNAHIARAYDGSYKVPAAIIESLLAEASKVLEGQPGARSRLVWGRPQADPGGGEPYSAALMISTVSTLPSLTAVQRSG